ncbi:MAG: prepilin-type N-terminal cleavage/methylation domain-containing protein [Nitrospiraceae bacterium]|nr:prepilin-type N-terminal cleavage/methylation domain-containing protein [Nitrospiraceae bacterium]
MFDRARQTTHRLPRSQGVAVCRAAARGFTLLEVLIAISILAMIVAVVYVTLVATVNATEEARLVAEELRLRQFLARSFTNNLSTVFTDPGLEDKRYVFLGATESGSGGEMDTLEFTSSSPMVGVSSPPGALKRVRYGAATDEPAEGDMLPGRDDELADAFASGPHLEASETPINESAPPQSGSATDTDFLPEFDLDGEDAQSWSVPISSFDLAYFDGEEWVEEWDSRELGRLPWCVRIRINYARTRDELEADRDARMSAEEDPDYEMVIPIATGIGSRSEAGEWYEAMWNLQPQGTP